VSGVHRISFRRPPSRISVTGFGSPAAYLQSIGVAVKGDTLADAKAERARRGWLGVGRQRDSPL